MWTERFVRNLKYDAVPRTMGLIELFNRVVAVTFDTVHATKSQYAKCTQCNNTVSSLRGVTTERPCRIGAND